MRTATTAVTRRTATTVADAHAGQAGMATAGTAARGSCGAFRDRFWWSLLLRSRWWLSSMFADLLGYTLPAGTGWISPVLGTVVFFYGGWPFLTGAVVASCAPASRG